MVGFGMAPAMQIDVDGCIYIDGSSAAFNQVVIVLHCTQSFVGERVVNCKYRHYRHFQTSNCCGSTTYKQIQRNT